MTVLTPPAFLQAGTYSALLDRIYGNTVPFTRNFSLLHGARQGFLADRFPSFTNPAGMDVSVTACAGIIRNTFVTDGGEYKFSNPSPVTVTLAASSPTLNRHDIIGFQVKDNFYDASGLNQVVPAVIQGANSAGTPTDPALPNSFISVCRAVVNATDTSPTLQDLRVYTTSVGGILQVANSTERDAIGSPRTGFTVWDIARNWAERWNGSSWQVQNTAVTSSVADRNAAITAPFNGQLAYTSDTGKMWLRHGGAWRAFPLTIVAQYRQTIAQPALTSGAFTDILLDTEDLDPLNAHSTSVNTARFVFPYDGTFIFSGGVCLAANATGTRLAAWAKNGITLPASDANMLTVGAGAASRIAARRYPVTGVAGDYVTLQGFQDSGGGLATVASGSAACSMTVEQG